MPHTQRTTTHWPKLLVFQCAGRASCLCDWRFTTADYHDRSADATSRAHAQRQRCRLPNIHRNELTFGKMDLFRKYLGAQQGDQLPSGVETVSVLPKTIQTCIHTFWTGHRRDVDRSTSDLPLGPVSPSVTPTRERDTLFIVDVYKQ